MNTPIPEPSSGHDLCRVGRSLEQRIAGAASCLRSATEHKSSAEALLSLKPQPREILGYLYHQIAEQWLMALVWYLDKELPLTHDLVRVVEAAQMGPNTTAALRRYCEELNTYVEEPSIDHSGRPSKADLAAARHAAERIVLAVHEEFVSRAC